MRPLLIALLLGLAFSVNAQSVNETVEVRLIEVDAVVTDRDAKPVSGLTAEDFELFENGRKQTITNFAEYRETTEQLPTAAKQPRTAVQSDAQRTVVLFIDALAVRAEPRAKLFESLRTLVARTMRDGDRGQVLLWNDRSGVTEATPLTGNRRAIEEAIASAERGVTAEATGPTVEEYARFFMQAFETDRSTNAAAPTASIEASKRFAADQELALMRRKTAAMERIVSSLANPRGKSIFVYVSEVFPMVAGKRALGRRIAADGPGSGAYVTLPLLEAVIRAANANGVSFYGLRAQQPRVGDDIGNVDDDLAVVENSSGTATEATTEQILLHNEVDALNLVAKRTGGAIGVGPAGVERAITRIAQDVTSYYTLAYQARSDGSDRERKIEVRPKNRNHVVRARQAIVEKSDRTRARDLVVARLFERGPAGDIEFDVKAGQWIPDHGSKNVLIPIELSIPAEELKFEQEGGELAARFSVITVSGASLQSAGEVTEESKRISAAVGTQPRGDIKFRFSVRHDRKPTTLSIAVFDEKAGVAGTRQIALESGKATVAAAGADPVAEATWTEALARATKERKPLVVYRRPKRCGGCTKFEKETLQHPTIQRRLEQVVFVTRAAQEPGFVLVDRGGTERAQWKGLPRDTAFFGSLLDGMIAVAPNFERAVALAEANGPHEGELEAAIGLTRLGRRTEARAAVARAMERGSPRTKQFAVLTTAMLDASEGKREQALASLERLASEATTAEVKANAWIGIATLHLRDQSTAEAIRAYENAAQVADAGSELQAAAQQALGRLRKVATTGGAVQLVPFEGQIVSGRRTVRTNVASAEVARVVFTVDGAEPRTVDRPPFSTTFDFGRVPQTRTIRAVAHDQNGRELGRDELTVNNAGETFWLRLVEPREGKATGKVRVSATMRAPAARTVKRVVISWNDVERAVLTAAPWQAEVEVPGEIGVVRAVAELDDGRVAEDAVLLNAGGHAERADVQLVELPIIVDGAAPSASDIKVREGNKQRAIETVLSGADAPLTIGVVIDSSASMQRSLPDVQEAALRFLDATLGSNDRAFLVTFDSAARLVQPPTTDRALLRERIMSIRPSGSTALHDAMILGLLQFEGIKGRRALVLFSDGVDRVSRYRVEDVAEVAKRSNIPIYVIAAMPEFQAGQMLPTAPPPPPPPSPRGAPGPVVNLPPRPALADPSAGWAKAMAELQRVSESSGGRTHRLQKLEALPEVYRAIEADLRAQVLAVIRTDAGKHEHDWRKIDVDVSGRRGVRAPAGYYAPW